MNEFQMPVLVNNTIGDQQDGSCHHSGKMWQPASKLYIHDTDIVLVAKQTRLF